MIEVTGTNTVAWLTGTFDGGDGHGLKSRDKRDGTVDVALPSVLRARGGPDKTRTCDTRLQKRSNRTLHCCFLPKGVGNGRIKTKAVLSTDRGWSMFLESNQIVNVLQSYSLPKEPFSAMPSVPKKEMQATGNEPVMPTACRYRKRINPETGRSKIPLSYRLTTPHRVRRPESNRRLRIGTLKEPLPAMPLADNNI